MKLTINKNTIETNSLGLIGTGGEADIYQLNQTHVLKVFKDSRHPDYTGNINAQAGARERIRVHQEKLLQFPKGLPSQVITPLEIAYDVRGAVRGYMMKLIPQGVTLWQYSQPGSYVRGSDEGKIISFLRSMYEVIIQIHSKKIVIGDFNDLNILVDQVFHPWFIDSDSYQFGKFLSKTFDERFVDPLLCITATVATHPDICSDGKSHIVLSKPHGEKSDWYAFASMVMQTLCSVGPYGGVYRPKLNTSSVSQHLRPMHRISILHPEVIYPKKARSLDLLPDNLVSYFEDVFKNDVRGIMPKSLLDTLRFTTCTTCHTVHAHAVCPNCNKHVLQPITSIFRGKVNAERIWNTRGIIVTASYDHELVYIYHDGISYRHSNGNEILRESYNPFITFYVSGSYTVYVRGNVLSVFHSDNTRADYPIDGKTGNRVALSGNRLVWISDGVITTEENILGVTTTKKLGTVLGGNTDIWTSDNVGFGKYRAGEIVRYFIFSPTHTVLNDNITLPPIAGKVIESNVYFSQTYIWYFILVQELGIQKVHTYLIDSKTGTLIATAVGQANDGSWIGSTKGKLASGNFLLSPSDDGIVRIEANGGTLHVAKKFPDTYDIVDCHTNLFPGKTGLSIISSQEIWQVSIK